MNANYSLNTYYGGRGEWLCRITFAYPGLGNTGEGERLAHNAIANAKRRIRLQISERMLNMPKRLAYEVVENSFTLGTGQLKTLTIAIKQNEGK
jgi:hypothetical protein